MTERLVLVLFNKPLGLPGAVESDAGVLHEVDAVCGALDKLGVSHRRAGVQSLADTGEELRHAPEACVINLVESLDGSAADACLVPAVCAAMGKAWTGNGTACQLLALDKWQSKCALKAAGVPVPEGIVIPIGRDASALDSIAGPVIVKPLRADASEGIDAASVIRTSDRQKIGRKIAQIHADFHQPALVEAYVEGREFNVSILERDKRPTVLPLAEIDFSAFGPERPRIVDYRAKWIDNSFEFVNTPRRIPADVEESTAEQIRDAALRTWAALGCRHYARIDMRVSADGQPFVIEANPNPDISLDAGFAAAIDAAGFGFEDFVQILIRESGVSPAPSPRPVREHGDDSIDVRRTTPADKPPILALLAATRVFRSCELDVAREVLEEALVAGASGHYQSYAAVRDDIVVGWVCFGPAPCTSGTFDLYWLAVDPRYGRRGIAAALEALATTRIRAEQGRLIVVETSSGPDYAPARRFYEAQGYRATATVAGFYQIGDDKRIFVKDLHG